MVGGRSTKSPLPISFLSPGNVMRCHFSKMWKQRPVRTRDQSTARGGLLSVFVFCWVSWYNGPSTVSCLDMNLHLLMYVSILVPEYNINLFPAKSLDSVLRFLLYLRINKGRPRENSLGKVLAMKAWGLEFNIQHHVKKTGIMAVLIIQHWGVGVEEVREERETQMDPWTSLASQCSIIN